ncbi:MAG: efflux RND transporter periplasmic adaptor subunit, partial [Verrucomicrobiaceae bacterium]
MKKRWILLLLLLIGIAAFVFWRGKSKPAADAGKTAANKPVAVILGTAEQRDVPVWLTGIGTAQAS